VAGDDHPRLVLLRELLAEDGSIWVSIDDNEGHYLKVLMDEIFGRRNFVDTIIWEKADSPRNSARQFSADHDYIFGYSKNIDWTPYKLPRTEASNAVYSNPDNDPRGRGYPAIPTLTNFTRRGSTRLKGLQGVDSSRLRGDFGGFLKRDCESWMLTAEFGGDQMVLRGRVSKDI
jgi:adenine-specific DNA-methyltransferase